MFGAKTRQRIERLEKRQEELIKTVWELKNPPKYPIRARVRIEERVPMSAEKYRSEGMIVGYKIERHGFDPYRMYVVLEDDAIETTCFVERDIAEVIEDSLKSH